jgi:nucleotide-binding universal stress UspA family protein
MVDDAIITRAREIGADLLVVGTHARKGAARFFIGSVAERTVRHAPVPTVVVPPSYEGALARASRPDRPLRVTAGVDASPASAAALEWLRALGRVTACDVRLVHLYRPSREHERLGLDPPDPFEADPEVVAVLSRDLGARVREHLGRSDVPLRVRPTWGAEEAPLAWEAESDDADLLVIGNSQRRHSVTLGTTRGSRVPVVCVPAVPTVEAAPRLEPVRAVLVTTDFSQTGDAAVAQAYRLVARGGGDVTLVHVAEPGKPGLGLDEDRREEIETCLLGLVPEAVDAHAVRTRAFVAVDSSPGEAILKAIHRFDPDVVVMSSHGRSGVGRAVHGSVTEHVVRASAKPVLVVPAPGRQP